MNYGEKSFEVDELELKKCEGNLYKLYSEWSSKKTNSCPTILCGKKSKGVTAKELFGFGEESQSLVMNLERVSNELELLLKNSAEFFKAVGFTVESLDEEMANKFNQRF